MNRLTRRQLVGLLAGGSAALLGAACSQTPAAPTAAPTAAPKPAQAPTAASTAPSPAVAPAAAASPSPAQASASPASAAASPAAASPTQAAPALSGPASSVKVTDIQITSAAGSYIAAERGYFRDEGLQAEFLPVSPADQVTAVVSGSAGVAGAAINSQLYNALIRGLPLKMMADHGANLKGASAGGVAYRKDLADNGTIKGPGDLKGMKVALAAPADSTTSDIAFEKWLGQANISEKDLDIVVIGLADMIAAYASKNIAACWYQEPFTTLAINQGLVVRGPIAYEMYPGQQIAVLVFGKGLSDDQGRSLAYLRAYTRGVRDYVKGLIDKDPAMFDVVVPILIQHTTVKDRAIFQQAIPSGLNANPVPNVKSITDDLDWFVKAGAVTQAFDIAPYIDVATVQQAIQQVGPA